MDNETRKKRNTRHLKRNEQQKDAEEEVENKILDPMAHIERCREIDNGKGNKKGKC